MKKKLIALLLLATLSVQALTLQWTFNRSNNTFTFSVPVKAGRNYSLARYDIKNDYYDVYTNWTATVTGTNTFVVDPLIPSDEDQPTPSGQCYFYIVEANFSLTSTNK